MYITIGYSYHVKERTVSKIVEEVCSSLWTQFMPTGTSWRTYESEFKSRWNFPKCVDAIDGKHLVIKAPQNSG